MLYVHISIDPSVFVGSRPGLRLSLAGASESRGTVRDQTAEEGPEWQLHKIIGGLCNLDSCKMLCRPPSCSGWLWLTCVLLLWLTFYQVHLTFSLPGCHRRDDRENLLVWAEFSFHTPVLMTTSYSCLLICLWLVLMTSLLIFVSEPSFLKAKVFFVWVCRHVWMCPCKEQKEAGAEVTALIKVLAFFSECSFHSRENERGRSRELRFGFTQSFIISFPALQCRLCGVFTSEGACETC